MSDQCDVCKLAGEPSISFTCTTCLQTVSEPPFDDGDDEEKTVLRKCGGCAKVVCEKDSVTFYSHHHRFQLDSCGDHCVTLCTDDTGSLAKECSEKLLLRHARFLVSATYPTRLFGSIDFKAVFKKAEKGK